MRRFTAMRFVARPAVVGKLLSQLYGLLAALTAVPCAVAFFDGGAEVGARYLIVIGVLAVLALAGRHLPEPERIQSNEALSVVALLFVSASLLMTLPMLGYGMPFIDAWFETVSGVTTTGLSTLSVEGRPAAFLFGRAWMQWIGGIGVTVFALALIVGTGGPLRSLGFGRSEMGDVVGGTRAHARRVVIVYAGLTAVGIAALLLAGAPLIDAITHCMAAVSTGGFANHGDSLASVGSLQLGILNALCIAGAISFHVYYFKLLRVFQGRAFDNQLLALGLAIGLGTLLVWGLSRLTGTALELGDLFSLVVSAQTTAGFSSVAIVSLPNWLLLLLCLAMVVGGGIGSTAGGIKLGRMLFLLGRLKAVLVRASLPRRVYTDVRVEGRRVGHRGVEDILGMVVAFGLVLALSWLLFLLHGQPPLPALFEVTSALATAGLSAGLTGAELPTALKLVLIANMLFGRLEVVVLLVLLAPRTWIGRRRPIERRLR
jgi:trk system potassium uptake protein TrkH